MAHGYALALLRDPGLAEDACQEAFVDAYLNLGQLREDAAFPGWFRLVVRKHADRQRRSRLLASELDDLPGTTDPLAAVLEAEDRRSMYDHVQALPGRLRTSLALFYGADLSISEIAGFLNVAPSAVKKRLFRWTSAASTDAATPGRTAASFAYSRRASTLAAAGSARSAAHLACPVQQSVNAGVHVAR